MRARITYFPLEGGKAKSAVVEVTPDELATLRAALALPAASLRHATAKIRTYRSGSSGPVSHLTYPLRVVSGIKPFKPRAPRTTGTAVQGEEDE